MAQRDPMDEAYEKLCQLLPRRLQPALRWLHSPRSRPVRIPVPLKVSPVGLGLPQPLHPDAHLRKEAFTNRARTLGRRTQARTDATRPSSSNP